MTTAPAHAPAHAPKRSFPNANAELVRRYEAECAKSALLQSKLDAQWQLAQAMQARMEQERTSHDVQLATAVVAAQQLEARCETAKLTDARLGASLETAAQRLRSTALGMSRHRIQFVKHFVTLRHQHIPEPPNHERAAAGDDVPNDVDGDFRDLLRSALQEEEVEGSAAAAASSLRSEKGGGVRPLPSLGSVSNRAARKASLVMLEMACKQLASEELALQTQLANGQLYEYEFDTLMRSVSARRDEIRSLVTRDIYAADSSLPPVASTGGHQHVDLLAQELARRTLLRFGLTRAKPSEDGPLPPGLASSDVTQSVASRAAVASDGRAKNTQAGAFADRRRVVAQPHRPLSAALKRDIQRLEHALTIRDTAQRDTAFQEIENEAFAQTRRDTAASSSGAHDDRFQNARLSPRREVDPPRAGSSITTSVAIDVLPKHAQRRPPSARFCLAAVRAGAKEPLRRLETRLRHVPEGNLVAAVRSRLPAPSR